MPSLLSVSRMIDRLSEWLGRWVAWLVLAAVFLLASGYTLLRQEHVRIDVIIGRFSKRTQITIEAVCIVLFLFPFGITVIDLVWPLVTKAWTSGEMSQNAGGLIRWPVYALVPLGFTLLMIQGVSELIKRVAFLKGLIPDPTRRSHGKSAEEELAEFLLQKEVATREAAAAAGGKP